MPMNHLSLVSLWCALLHFLRPFPQHCEVRCRVEASFLAKLSYLIGRPLRTKALKMVSQTASPSTWSFVSSSCPPMEKLTRSSESPKPQKLFCIVLPQLLGCPHSENKFFQAGLCFTVCLKQVHKHKLLVPVCKHNAKPATRQWVYSERSHHACENLLELLVCWVSSTLGAWFFGILASAHTSHT